MIFIADSKMEIFLPLENTMFNICQHKNDEWVIIAKHDNITVKMAKYENKTAALTELVDILKMNAYVNSGYFVLTGKEIEGGTYHDAGKQ